MKEQTLSCVNRGGRWVPLDQADPAGFYFSEPVQTGPFIVIGGELDPNANLQVTARVMECVKRDVSCKMPGHHHNPELDHEFLSTDEVTDSTGEFFVGVFVEKGTATYGGKTVKTYSPVKFDKRTKRAVRPRV